MLPVIWSEKAKRNYAEIIDILSDKSVNAALKLDQQTGKLMTLISEFPFSFQASSKNPKYRRCVIGKNYSAIYEVREKFIYIVSFVYSKEKN